MQDVYKRQAEGRQGGGHGVQLAEALVEEGAAARIAGEGGEHLVVAAADGDEAQDFVGLLPGKAQVVHQDGAHLVRADFVQLVHRAHDVAGALR